MKTQKLLPFSVLLFATMLACSTVTNLATQPTVVSEPSSVPISTSLPTSVPTPASNIVFFEETEFVDACKTESTVEVERFAENGQFIMNVVTSSYVGWTECTDAEYADFVVEVDATQVSGPDNNAYGVILRYGLQSDDFYAFLISGDGYYAFTVDGANHTDPEFLADWAESSAINKGAQTNKLKVVAVGSSIKYYANDQLLGEVQDSRFPTGTLGFFVGSVEEGNVRIAFDNLRVSEP